MQKKLEAELMSIAHAVLQMKNRDDLKALKKKTYEIYEKLTVLDYIETYVKETPQNAKTVEELVTETFSNDKDIVEAVEVEAPIVEKAAVTEEINTLENETEALENKQEETVIEEKQIIEEPDVEEEKVALDLFTKMEPKEEPKVKEDNTLKSSLEKEFGATVSLDVATDMFENATRISQTKSINEAAMNQKNLQLDLNDRIAFVKHLFDNSQEDFNRVISQLNTMTSEKEALSFLKMVKKEYNWGGKEIYEDRLLLLIERKFN